MTSSYHLCVQYFSPFSFDLAAVSKHISESGLRGDRGDSKQREFQNILRAIGFEVKLKPFIQRADGSAKGDWDVGITVEALDHADDVDEIILVSGDGDFDILVNALKAKGKTVTVYGVPALTAESIQKVASKYVPIDATLLL